MEEKLWRSELLDGLDKEGGRRILEIARPQGLRAGEYLFLLGEAADRLYVVVKGTVEICFPLALAGSVQDVSVESKEVGRVVGWSALVRPYRFTLSARAAEPSQVAAFPRRALLDVFDAEPRIGLAFTRRLAEVIGHRLLKMEALWARELQRAVAGGVGPTVGAGPARGGG
jgi:CRP-like cAMP-binding protein